MNTKVLTDALRSFDPDAYEWKFAIYSQQKSRDGIELEWNLCEMSGIASRIEATRTMLLKKPVADKPVAPYTPFLSDKENIGALSRDDETIKEQIDALITNLQHSQAYPAEDFLSGVLPKITGHAFYAENESGPVLFMRRANPFLTGGKLCVSEGGELVPSDKPIVKLTAGVDFLLIGEVCYIFSSAIEKDFSLENRHMAIAAKRLDQLAEQSLISDIDRLAQAALTPKNARKFVDFDREIVKHIARLPIPEREEFLSTYGVIIDAEGKMDSSSAEQCEMMIDLLCCRSCLDPLGRLAVGSNITPRE